MSTVTRPPTPGSATAVTVLGWDGRPLPGDAAAVLTGADLVVGGRRHLDAVPVPPDARTVVMGDVTAALDEVCAQAADGRRVVVLASGDPGFFGIVRALRSRGVLPRVLPAVSSVAAAFARLGLPWDDALVVSAHGRDLRPVVHACRAHPKVAVLTGPDADPAAIGASLVGTGRRIVVAEDLGGDECVTECTPDEAAGRSWRDPNIVLVLDQTRASGERGWLHGAGRTGAAPGWALDVEAFDHRDGMVTKPEVRALALARLGPRLGELVWDVGAGSGAVGIECAGLGAAVVAVDRDADACSLVQGNADAHEVPLQVVCGQAPDVLAELPHPDAVFVGGGGPDVVTACADRRPARLVVAVAAVERVGPTLAALTAGGYHADGVQLAASRLSALPDGSHRLAAANPVYVLWGVRT